MGESAHSLYGCWFCCRELTYPAVVRRRSFVASLILSTSPFITCLEKSPELIATLVKDFGAIRLNDVDLGAWQYAGWHDF